MCTFRKQYLIEILNGFQRILKRTQCLCWKIRVQIYIHEIAEEEMKLSQ